jgi:hypothetical protein
MSEHGDPRWELLPHDPEGFFGLEGDYDLRDLKRSYNQWIRRFKPEKFPEEFQRIRTAYEALSNSFRFQVPPAGSLPVPAPPAPRPASERPSRPTGRSYGTSAYPEADLAPKPTVPPKEALKQKSPRDLYEELRCKSSKSPEDYVALAFLADVIGSKGSGARPFFEWLLAGLMEYPGDWGLVELVRAFLLQPHPPAELARLLSQTVHVIAPERFQYATELAWDRLLSEGAPEHFSESLRECGDVLGRALGMWQVMFYVHVLRKATWKADPGDIAAMREVIDDHFHSLDRWVQREFELTSLILDYLPTREAFVARGPACQRIDQAVRDWCLLPEQQADARILDCFYFLSQRGSHLLSEFPDPREPASAILLLWERIAEDVLERQEQPPPLDPGLLGRHTRDFMIRVHRRQKRTVEHFKGLWAIVGAMALALVTLITAGSLFVRMFVKFISEGRILSGLLDGFLSLVVFVVGIVVAFILVLMCRKWSKLKYEHARGELIKLLRVAALPVDEVAQVIEAQEGEKFGPDNDEKIDDTELIANPLRSDLALSLFATAQVALRAALPEVLQDHEPEVVVEVLPERVVPPNRPVGTRFR